MLSRHQWRKEILKRYPVCNQCKRNKSTDAHHLDHDSGNNIIENGEGLCEGCHHEYHIGNIARITVKFRPTLKGRKGRLSLKDLPEILKRMKEG